jgi:hypothetical protein
MCMYSRLYSVHNSTQLVAGWCMAAGWSARVGGGGGVKKKNMKKYVHYLTSL